MEEYSQVFYLLSVCFSVFSFCCVLIASIVIIFTRFRRGGNDKVLLACFVADGILLSGLCLDARIDFQCQMQGLLINWGCLATLTYAGIIMYLQYAIIVYGKLPSLLYLGTIGLVMTGLVAGLEFSLDFYKKSSIFCGISADSNDLSVVIMAYFSPIVFTVFFCLCVSLKIEKFFKDFECGLRPEEFAEKFKNFSEFKKYSWCIILFNCGFAVYSSYYWINQEKNIFIDIVGLVALALSGYFISLVFLFNVFGFKHKTSKVSALVHSNPSVQDSE